MHGVVMCCQQHMCHWDLCLMLVSQLWSSSPQHSRMQPCTPALLQTGSCTTEEQGLGRREEDKGSSCLMRKTPPRKRGSRGHCLEGEEDNKAGLGDQLHLFKLKLFPVWAALCRDKHRNTKVVFKSGQTPSSFKLSLHSPSCWPTEAASSVK